MEDPSSFDIKVDENVIEAQFDSATPIPYISKMTQTGKMTIEFSQPMQPISLTDIDLSTFVYEVSPGVWVPSLTLNIESSEEQEPEKVRLESWNVTAISSTEMDIKMVFESPLDISYSEPDSVVVNFSDKNLFKSDKGVQLPDENSLLKRELMRQLPEGAEDIQAGLNSGAESSKFLTFFLLFLNLFM